MDYATAIQCAVLSQDVYQDFKTIQFKGESGAQIELIDEPSRDTQLAILYWTEKKLAFIVFRGSEAKLRDWSTNFGFGKISLGGETDPDTDSSAAEVHQRVQEEFEPIKDPYTDQETPIRMHRGFTRAYLSVRDRIHTAVKDKDLATVIVTGHSLGGALATLCGLDLEYNFSEKFSVTVYTYGSPRVGNRDFVFAYNRRVPNTFRFYYGRDIVTRVPRLWMGYRHVSKALGLGSWFNLKIFSRRIDDHMLDRYISALQVRAGQSSLGSLG
jgi:predicted lipase